MNDTRNASTMPIYEDIALGTSESIGYSGLGGGSLDWLVGVARQTGIHLTKLRQLSNIGFISHSGVLRLDLDNLLECLHRAAGKNLLRAPFRLCHVADVDADSECVRFWL